MSDVVNIDVVYTDGNSSAAKTVPVDVTFAVTYAPNGGGGCEEPGFLASGDGNKTCVAGCCEEGACNCHPGFSGELCQSELRCGLSKGDHGSSMSDDA